jgi:hypothetical protein
MMQRAFEGDPRALNFVLKMTQEVGLFETLQDEQRPTGVLLIGSPQSLKEWEEETAEQQRQYREAPYVKTRNTPKT